MVAVLQITPSNSPVFSNAVALVSVPRGATIAQRAFRDALTLINHVADRKSTLPILSHVAMRAHSDGILLCATDLSVTLTVRVASQGGLTSGVTIPARPLLDMVKLLPGPEITIDRSERGITLSAGRAISRIVGLSDRDFPKIPVAPESTIFHAVEGSALLGMIESTMFSVCRDETRFHLNGALLEGTGGIMRMVTTDGHRLTMASRAVSGVVQRGVIIPAKGLQEIKRLLDGGTCHLGFSASHMFVRQAGAELAIKLTDAQFPPYGQVIPKDNPHVVTVGRKALIDAFSRARMLASGMRGVRITSDSGDLVIASDNPDMGDMTERVAIEGPTTTRPNDRLIKTGCNAVYMIEALDRIDDERVTIAFPADELGPFLLRPAGDVALGDSEFQAVIMPMRI